MEEEEENEKVNDVTQFICQFCSSKQENMVEHLRTCPGISPDQTEERPTFFRIVNKGNICKRCFLLLTEKDWQHHRKSQVCLKASKKEKSSRQFNRPRSQPSRIKQQSSLFSSLMHSEGRRKKQSLNLDSIIQEANPSRQDTHPKEGIYQVECMNIIASILAPMVRQWTSKNQTIDIHVSVAHLSSAVTQFGTCFFQKQLKMPTWAELSKIDKTFYWTSFLERPQNIFNSVFLDEKLRNINSTKKLARTIKALNKVAKKFPGLMKRRDSPRVKRKLRENMFIRLKDIFQLIEQLIKTGKRKIVHFGLDLYLILLSAQRFQADYQSIQVGVVDLLSKNKERSADSQQLIFQMIIGKTGVRHLVCLNSQLLLMLRQFQWTGFNDKTMRLVQRMSSWLGIRGYRYKHTLMSIAARYSPSLELPQRMSGHTNIKSTTIYTSEAMLATNLEFYSKLAVPNLHQRFGVFDAQQVTSFFDSFTLPHIRYTQFKQDWLQRLLSLLYTQKYESQLFQDSNIDFTAFGTTLIRQNSNFQDQNICQNRQNLVQVQEQRQNQDQILSNSFLQRMIQQEKVVTVYGNQYGFDQGQFKKENLFAKVISYTSIKCTYCSEEITPQHVRLCCVYCYSHFHTTCSLNSCYCINSALIGCIIPSLTLNESELRREKLNLAMPTNYMHSSMISQEQQIKILLSIRRFKYTRIPVIPPGIDIKYPQNYWKQAPIIEIKDFLSYKEGVYMPPVEARPLGNILGPVFGTEFGLFSLEEIPKHVFIGQYACDVMNGIHLSTCKKNDSIMLYSRLNGPHQLYLAPKDFCGYVPLINSGSEKNSNCKTIKAIIDGALRIIIYSSKTIQAGEELLYNYGPSYKFHWKQEFSEQ